jgi:signal transduction histidine kinase/DNA-binding response OmpR family regulator/CHASE3 domain sensor protein
MFKNMSFNQRILLSFGIALVSLLILAYISISSLNQMNTLSIDLMENRYPKVAMAQNNILRTIDNGRQLRSILLSTDTGFNNQARETVTKNRAAIAENMEKIQALINTEQGTQLLREVKEKEKLLNPLFDTVFHLLKTDPQRAKDFLIVDFAIANNAYWQALEKFSDFQEKLMQEGNAQAQATYLESKKHQLIVIVGASAITLFACIWLSLNLQKLLGGDPIKAAKVVRQIAQGDVSANIELNNATEDSLLANMREVAENLKRISKQADLIGKGDLTIEIVPRSEHDLLGHSFCNMLNLLRQSRSEEQNKNWIKDGRNQLSSRLTGDLSLKQLSDTAIEFLGRYMQAGRGVLYLWNEQDHSLELYGSYMYSERHHLAGSFKLGEGAIGQVAKECKPIILHSGHQELESIITGTTLVPALYTYTYPLMRENHLLGVLELATMERFNEIQIEFLSNATDTIAAFVFITEQQVNIQQLLSITEKSERETRLQNEQLQKINVMMEEQQQQLQQQSEEMQLSNNQLEEQQQQLQQQSEELRLANAQMQDQQKILEQKNSALALQQEESIEKAKQLEQAGQYKTEFLANMSHELRTPLNAILLLSKLMSNNKKNPLSTEDKQRVEVIHRSGKDLLNLINDVLDLSKIEAGHMDVHFTSVSTSAFANDLQELFVALAKEKGVDFIIDDQLQNHIVIDVDKLGQIIRNLLTNAFKFTKQGAVTLSLKHQENSNYPICISVSDSGIGIAEDRKELIFEAFRQADGSTSREFGGTGLGLTISLRLAQLMGGTIELDSRLGQGSIFSLMLPLHPNHLIQHRNLNSVLSPLNTNTHQPLPKSALSAPAINQSLDPALNQTEHGIRILLIDDDLDFARAVIDMNQQLGYTILHATTAAEGLQLAREQHPAGILLDLGLPDRDGAELLSELKSSQELAKIPVFVISARDPVDMLRNHSILGYLQKPIDQEQLFTAERQLINAVETSQDNAILILSNGGVSATEIRCLLQGRIEYEHLHIDEWKEDADSTLSEFLSEHAGSPIIIDLHQRTAEQGIALAQQVKQQQASSTLLFFSSWNLSEEDEVKLRSFSDSLILKSAHSTQRLLNEIEHFLKDTHPSPNVSTQSDTLSKDQLNEETALLNRKILVVDDDLRNLFVMTDALERCGAQISTAINGRKAIEQLQQTQFDMVFMDIMMPELDGYQTISAIRSDPRIQQTKIVALTAKAMPQDKQKIMEIGADDYLSKPVDYQNLINVAIFWSNSERQR